MEIRCKKGNCHFNTGCACSAKTVEIDRGVTCNSYTPDKDKEDMTIENGNLFDVAEKMADKDLKNVPLACRATDCLYNHTEKCHANGITVTDGEQEKSSDCADCVTYIKR